MDIAALGSAPIPGDNPAGSEAKYEPEYEAVLAEIDKLGSATQGGAISWPVVAEKAEAVLANKSKDLLIAAYLAVAWQEIRGAEGLRDALTLFSGLFTNFWETAFPPLARLRRRTNAFDWWHERALAFLQNPDKNSQPLPAVFLNELEEKLGELDRLVGDLMPDALPLRDMNEPLRRLPVLPEEKPPEPEPSPPAAVPEVQPAPEKTPVQPPEAATPAPEAAPPAVPPSPPQEVSTPATSPVSPDEEFAASRKNFIEAASRYALLSHRVDVRNPEPWQLVRMALWAKVQTLPPADKGQTMLPPPDAMHLSSLHSLLTAGKQLEAALGGEDFFPSALFCLDLQYLIDRALDELGSDYAEAQARVRMECGRFVRRLPGVELLTFSDGTPFAAPETRTWLQNLAEPAFAASSAASISAVSAPRPAGGNAGGEADILAQAEELFQKKQLDAALQLLENAQGMSPADNLILQVGELRLLCRAGEKTVAAALAQSLLETLDKRDLDNWNPPLAVTVLLALRDTFSLIQDQETALTTQRRLARLRPSAALGWQHNL